MPCLCGDIACPSCGPAQGYDLAFEAAVDVITEMVGTADPVDQCDVAKVLGVFSPYPRIVDLIGRLVSHGKHSHGPLSDEEAAKLNAELDAMRPCEHGVWGDCVECEDLSQLEWESSCAEYEKYHGNA